MKPFFKHKVLQQIENTKRRNNNLRTLSWFTPQIQMSSIRLLVLIIKHAGALLYAFSNSRYILRVSDIDTFAQEYSLQTESDSL